MLPLKYLFLLYGPRYRKNKQVIYFAMFISLAIHTQYKYLPMPHHQTPVPSLKIAFERLRDTTQKEVAHGLKVCTHAQFRIKRVKDSPQQMAILQEVLEGYITEEHTVEVKKEESEFIVSIIERKETKDEKASGWLFA